MLTLRPLTPSDKAWAAAFLNKQAGGSRMVSKGKLLDAVDLPGFIGILDDEPCGLLTYHIANHEFELFTLHTAVRNQGIGSALLQQAINEAKRQNCHRIWLITTNDNTSAMRFYQKRGMAIAAVHINALEKSRRLKPEIPLLGNDGIPIRDEIEFEIRW